MRGFAIHCRKFERGGAAAYADRDWRDVRFRLGGDGTESIAGDVSISQRSA